MSGCLMLGHRRGARRWHCSVWCWFPWEYWCEWRLLMGIRAWKRRSTGSEEKLVREIYNCGQSLQQFLSVTGSWMEREDSALVPWGFVRAVLSDSLSALSVMNGEGPEQLGCVGAAACSSLTAAHSSWAVSTAAKGAVFLSLTLLLPSLFPAFLGFVSE